MSNAIRHNIDDGHIIISLNETGLTFKNTGLNKPLDYDDIFERFKKGKRSDGVGLGLALVSNICQLYQWKITYSYKDQYHIFQINF